MDALAAGGDLHAAQQQVKGQRVLGILRVIHRIEGALFGGVVRHKHKVCAVFLLEQLSNQLLLLRLKVVRVADFPVVLLRHHLLGPNERHLRDTLHLGQRNGKQLQLRRILAFQHRHHMLQHRRLHLHHIGEAVDVAHFKIQ